MSIYILLINNDVADSDAADADADAINDADTDADVNDICNNRCQSAPTCPQHVCLKNSWNGKEYIFSFNHLLL